MTPVEYIIKPVGPALDGCEDLSGGYSLCPNTSLLLDTVNGPRDFSETVLTQYYTQFANGERTLFKFSSDVHIEVIQVYYYATVISEEPVKRIGFTFYSINDDSYVPRRQIPEEAIQLNFTTNFDLSGHFKSLCFTLKFTVKNLLVASATRHTELHVSEINFFSSPVSNRVCKGIYLTPTIGKQKCFEQYSGWGTIVESFSSATLETSTCVLIRDQLKRGGLIYQESICT